VGVWSAGKDRGRVKADIGTSSEQEVPFHRTWGCRLDFQSGGSTSTIGDAVWGSEGGGSFSQHLEGRGAQLEYLAGEVSSKGPLGEREKKNVYPFCGKRENCRGHVNVFRFASRVFA